MICRPIKKKSRWILTGIAATASIAIYSALSWVQHSINASETTIPNASQLLVGLRKITELDASGNRWIIEDTIATGIRFISGMAVGVSLSLIIGMLVGCYEVIEALLLPGLVAWAKVPATAMLAVYFILFGTDSALFIAIIALSIIPTMTIAIHGAIKKDVREEIIFKTYTLGASEFEVITVVFKQIFPRILQNIQLQIGPALVYLIASEWLMSDIGFGYRLRMQSRLLNMNCVYCYLALLALFGYFADLGLTWGRRWICPWFGE